MRKLYILFFLQMLTAISSSQCPTEKAIRAGLEEDQAQVLDQLLWKALDCGLPDSLLGDAFHRLGILHYLGDQLDSAILATRQAILIRKRSLHSEDLNLGKSNHNIGVFYKQSLQFQKAIPYFQEAARIYEHLKIERAIESRKELASVYHEISDNGLALQNIQLACYAGRHLGAYIPLAKAYIDYGQILIHQNQIGTAIDTLKEAERLLLEHDPLALSGQSIDLAACYLNLANAQDEKSDFSTALSYYNQSLKIGQSLNEEEMVAKSLNNIGISYQKLGKYEAAKQTFKQLIRYLDKKPVPYLRAYAYDNLGSLAHEQGQTQLALQHYQEAIHILIPAIQKEDLSVNPRKEEMSLVSQKADLLIFLADKAQAWKAWYEESGLPKHLEEAMKAYQTADVLLDLMRLEHQSLSSKFFWRKEAKHLYEAALEVCFLLNDQSTAFYFMEKSKAILLLDALMTAEASSLLPDSLAQKELSWQRKILAATKSVELSRQAGQESFELDKKLLEYQFQYSKFLQDLQLQFPTYYQLRYASSVLSMTEARELLKGRSSYILHYFAGRENIYLLKIGMDNAVFKKIARDQELDNILLTFQQEFQHRSKIIDNPAAYHKIANQVYQRLYAPVWDSLSHEKVIIIPDGQISFLPFEALLFQMPTPNQVATANYLINVQQFSYAYSATVLSYQQKLGAERKGNERLLFFAPFIESHHNLPALANSKVVLKAVKARFMGQFLEGETANLEQLKQAAPAYTLIHLATHADAGNEEKQPSIAFADSSLSLNEIYAMPLQAGLVVLSACETGLGDIEEGEGVISLARGFAYSGASGLITSLWKVNDAATAQLFDLFYQNLANGEKISDALYHAKLQYLDNDALRAAEKSPYFWSGFSFWGNDQSLDLRKKRDWIPWILGLGLMVLIAVVTRHRFRKT